MTNCGDVKKVFVKSNAEAVPEASVIKGIQIEAVSAEKIKTFLKQENKAPDAHGLYIKVVNDGCSGKSYVMDLKALADAESDGDRLFQLDGANVFVDKSSYLFVAGSILDYKEALTGSGFSLYNPNVKRSCSCGSSFST
ncbi:iron-sulfur cluster assembly accessory protein [Candidatus Marinamargulisbacteria bacterium]|nr:iron-sulfur cluster assembly accessory protein [bacterium]MDA7563860.1 iron-sulfur cluster assembly accessory protein [Candidatus Marinamargulisbacteria bacterium]MDG2264927.1 iron-sulfur cluster assembly accessory protein [Candidatus Marinamargulisbacteria bacterium]|tara:strand:+ start:3716 stop:4132 length:417 start_codon:yes stop_codon:yes gene_type:complete